MHPSEKLTSHPADTDPSIAEAVWQDARVRYTQLDSLAQSYHSQTYPGYPVERLVADPASLERDAGNQVILPDGPWTVNEHDNRMDTERLPDEQTRLTLQQELSEFDSVGRPLHPWFNDMLGDPRLGVYTGKGAYWRWGPNRTVDPIVVQNRHLLLIKRGDTGAWALPGGFIDKNETTDQAARREAFEETGLHIAESIVPKLVYCGPVTDTRVTANAWAETTALLYQLPDVPTLPVLQTTDETIGWKWQPLETLMDSGDLFGSHRYLAQTALQHLV